MADAITVSCPSCRTTFPVDPDKVPEGGVNARCSECQDIFRVEAPLEEVVPEFEEPGEVGPTETEELPGLDVSAPPAEEPVSLEEESGAPEAVEAPEAEEEEEAGVGAEFALEEGEEAVEDEVAPGEEVGEVAAEADEGFETGFDDYFSRTEEGAGAETATEEPPAPELPTLEEEGPEAEEAGVELEPGEAEEEVEAEEPGVETVAADLETAETDTEVGAGIEAEPGTVAAEPEPEPAPAETPRPTFGNRSPEEKAQRLARVLVSDMITYNPTMYETALARGSLKEDFADEIEKSWEEYVEQVGEELANSTSYWTEALNDILAKGEQTF